MEDSKKQERYEKLFHSGVPRDKIMEEMDISSFVELRLHSDMVFEFFGLADLLNR